MSRSGSTPLIPGVGLGLLHLNQVNSSWVWLIPKDTQYTITVKVNGAGYAKTRYPPKPRVASLRCGWEALLEIKPSTDLFPEVPSPPKSNMTSAVMCTL